MLSDMMLFRVFISNDITRNMVRFNNIVDVYIVSNRKPNIITKRKYFLSLAKYGYITTNAMMV